MRKMRFLGTLVFLSAATPFAIAQTPQGSNFTYQGQINLNDAPLNDTADFEFTLWDAAAAGNMIGAAAEISDIDVVGGLFTTDLDFGVDAFNGEARWLEIRVASPSGSNAFTTLSPRQPLTAAPYAIQTRGLFVDAAGNVGIGKSNPTAALDVNGTVTATAFVGDASGLTNLPILTLSEGMPEAWGLDLYGQVSETPTTGGYVGVSAGFYHCVAIRNDGSLVSWGYDLFGQVSQTPDTGAFVAVASALNHNVAIRDDGSLVSWGDDTYGQISQTPDTGTFVAVAAASYHSVAIRDDGSLVSWGSDSAGLISQTPTTGTYVAVAAGDYHSVAIRADGALISWGSGADQTPATGTYVAVAASSLHSVAITADGSLASWGDDSYGQVSQTPITGSYIAVAAGEGNSVAIRSDGSFVSWGNDNYGQISQTPTTGVFTAVSAGGQHIVAIRSDGLVSFGGNKLDKLSVDGDADFGGNVGIRTNDPGAPLQIGDLDDASAFKHGAEGPHHLVSNRDIVFNAFDSDPNTSGTTLFLFRRNNTKFEESTEYVDLIRITDQGHLGLNRTPTANRLEVEGDASKSASGMWQMNSDRRIKTHIEPVSDALDTLDRVRLVSFEYTDDYKAHHNGVGDRRYLNVIAQEFAEVFPDHVKGSGELLPDGSEILQVDTYPLTIYSAAAIQELRAALKAKSSEIESLHDVNADLAARITRLETILGRSSR